MNVRLAVAVVIGFVLLLVSASLQAFDPQESTGAPMFDARMQGCFSQAMVGMDSVINARVGVPAEHALDLAVRDVAGEQHGTVPDEPVFDEPLLVMILTAYLWKRSPHDYAIKVFYDCAASSGLMAERNDFLR